MNVSGFIDLHLHSAPDVRPRRYDDVELAQAAKAAGYQAILLKSHHTLTADRAAIAQRVVPGIRVYGGLALNWAVGGLNLDAVDAALAMGAKQIWFPTRDAAVEFPSLPHKRRSGPVHVLGPDKGLLPEAWEVLELTRDAGALIGTGHLAREEIFAVAQAAREINHRKLVVTHPEHPYIGLSLGDQRELASMGAHFERCSCFTLGAIPDRPVDIETVAEAVRALGAGSSVLSSDLGRRDLMEPIEGLHAFCEALVRSGVAEADIRRMCADNPARLLEA